MKKDNINIEDKKKIENGICPFCSDKFYNPSSSVGSLGYHIAFSLHFPSCRNNPDQEIDDIEKMG